MITFYKLSNLFTNIYITKKNIDIPKINYLKGEDIHLLDSPDTKSEYLTAKVKYQKL